ncbi:pVII [Simian adenovirus 24]|uniref:Pre-histone-like nucleoprotein n=1 Tax=Simian adenovirus 24 TaxID=175568 RepID=Q6QPA8_9ADEN|nr:pVII [Simian adenovirus 24]
MSILISPSNNTGWGLRAPSKMYGGARQRSTQHPVRVRGHFRAPWGALKGRVRSRTTVDDVIDQVVADARNYTPAAAPASTVDAVIDSVVADARRYARAKSRRRRIARRHRSTPAMRAARALLRRARRTGRRAMLRAARRAASGSSSAGRTRRRAATAAAAAIASMSRPRRGNVYWVRDAATGVRVPVRTRPPRT